MQCPRCAFRSHAETAQCPQCQGTYSMTVFEEFGHLEYTQGRLDRWWADGTIPARLAQRLISLTEADKATLRRRMGLPDRAREFAGADAAMQVPASSALPRTGATPAPVATRAIGETRVPSATAATAPVAGAVAAAAATTATMAAGPVPAGATVPLALRPTIGSRLAPTAAAPPPSPRPARPPRPAFSWKQVGTYLLSERTLNALLGLGAFLILAAAFVISTVNPTGLDPRVHLATMIVTTMVFYGAGVLVQQRLKLMRTGAALLAIGAAFIPLVVWTFGRDILEWEPRSIWVLASILSLPIYLASHFWLRDRAFALLTAIAGASLVMSLTHPLGVAPVWGACALVGLAGAYLVLAHRLQHEWEHLSWALFWTAQVATPIVMAVLMALRFGSQAMGGSPPSSWLDALGALSGASLDYAVGTAWWLGAAFYALSAHLFPRRAYALATAWTVPCAYLLTLTKAPFGAEWYGACLAALGMAYLAFGRHVQRLLAGVARPSLAQLLEQPAYQVGLALSALAALWPFVPPAGRFASPSESLTLWLLVCLYAVAAYTFRHIAFRYAAAYLIPATMAAAPHQHLHLHLAWLPDLPSLGISLLAACYLLFGRFALGMARLGDRRAAYVALAREPIFQVAGLLTIAAALWPTLTPQMGFATATEIVTLLAVASLYGAAAFLLSQRAWAYVAMYLLPVAYGLGMAWLGFGDGATLLGWALLAVALVVAAEVAARRTAEGDRSLASTVVGWGAWRSRFASPLFSAGFAVSALAVALGLNQGGALSRMPMQGIAGLLLVCALYAASAAGRRTSLFLYPATWLFLLPVSAMTAHAYARAGLAFDAPQEARLLALLGLGYLGLAFLVDRARRHYAKPVYLAAYALAALSIAMATPDRAITVQALGMDLLGIIWSAWLVDRGRHPSYAWVVEQMVNGAPVSVVEAAEMLFQYLAIWLFPVWLLLLQSLRQPAPAPADCGIMLASLAPLYAALSLCFKRIHAAYRLPWLIGGYALSVLGPLVALPDPTLRIVALSISIALYVASALQSRRHQWLWLAAALGPALLLEALVRFGDPARSYGIAVVGLSLGYGALGLIIQRVGVRHLLRPLRERPYPFALPFLATGQALCPLGLALVANTQDTGLMLIGFTLGALHYACTACISRSHIAATPLAITLAVVYVSGMLLSPLSWSQYGTGLLPGLVAFLSIGEFFRRKADVTALIAERRNTRISGSWARPFNAFLHLGAAAAFLLSAASGGYNTLTWWGLAALYLSLSALRRQPGPLYPAIGVALASYLATAHLLIPNAAFATMLATLALPVWGLFWLAYAIGRLPSAGAAIAPRHLRWSGAAGAAPWARPPLFWGITTLAYSAVLSGIDALISSTPAQLFIALSYLALIGILSLLWQSRLLVWGGIVLAALACQEALMLAGVSQCVQPACWAAVALVVCLLGMALDRQAGSAAQLWAMPLRRTAIVAGTLALGVAAGNLTLGHYALEPLAVTMAVVGVIPLMRGIIEREPALRYLGIVLLNGGYVCELLSRQVAQPQAFTLPLGLALLLTAYLEWRRGAAGAKVLLEIAALVVLLGATLVQGCGGLDAGIDRYGYDILLLLESLVVFGLGAVLRWTRTFFAACGALVAAVLLLLADPLRAMNFWYLLAIIGCTMVVLVIFLEQRRQQIPLWIDEVRLRLETWD